MPRDVGDWSRDKLKILELYLPGYLQVTSTAIDRVYIDAFAGPGLNRLRRSGELIDGSPLIALDAKASNGSRFTELFFIEKDAEVALELGEVIKERDAEGRAQVVTGDANVELPKVVAGLHQRAPTFVFIDPEGIDPHWRTIEAISRWQTELLINFPLGMAINRNVESTRADAFFGTTDWREAWAGSERGRARRVLDFYKNRLVELGYTKPLDDERLVKSQGGQHLYYLMFVSKVDPAKTIMTWVFKQPGADQQGRLL